MTATITWNRKAIRQFGDAIAYIKQDSLSNAEKFKLDILKKSDGLLKHSERYSPDKYKTGNNRPFRAFDYIVIELPTGIRIMNYLSNDLFHAAFLVRCFKHRACLFGFTLLSTILSFRISFAMIDG